MNDAHSASTWSSNSINEIDIYNFDFNNAFQYTCLTIRETNKNLNVFCGYCDTCQIEFKINEIKQWFERASTTTKKRFLFSLLKLFGNSQVKNEKLFEYLNIIMKPLMDGKDAVYSRAHKLVPSNDVDHLKLNNNRCLNMTFVQKSIKLILAWFTNNNFYVKLNFLLRILKLCDHSLIVLVMLKLQTVNQIRDPKSTLSNYLSDDEEMTQRPDTGMTRSVLSAKTQTSGIYTADDTDFSDADNNIDSDYDNEDSEYHYVDPFASAYRNFDYDRNLLYGYSRIERKAQFIDFIRQLPVHLSKYILNLIDRKELRESKLVSKYWHGLIKEMFKDFNSNAQLEDDMMLLRGTTSKISNPKYANDVYVKIPNLYPETDDIILQDNERQQEQRTKRDYNWVNAYSGISTRNVMMEERNVFCSSYNVLLLKEFRDPHRVVHMNGSSTVALGSFNKKIRFIDIKTASEKPMYIMHGHAGSIRCIYISETKNIVLTGSYDTSIRCWSIITGKCLRIYQGHQDTVTSLSFNETHERIISGSRDRTCKIWLLSKKRVWQTFKNNQQISAVTIGDDLCASGGFKGCVKIYKVANGVLLKVLQFHTGLVTGIKLDKFHVVTCSTDGYAFAFSALGNLKKCLISMRHPKAVLCIEMKFLRVITGSADGKVRIWNILNGDCLRIMRGTSQLDPVLSLGIYQNRILINTEYNVILMEFEIVNYEYGSQRELDAENVAKSIGVANNNSATLKRPYSAVRANRMDFIGTVNPRIFNDGRKSALSHSSGPMSNKHFEDAKFVQSMIMTNNTRVNSSVSTQPQSALSIRSGMNRSNLSIRDESKLSQKSAVAFVNEDKESEQIDLKQINYDQIHRYKNVTLDETKNMFKHQLKNMRQEEYKELVNRKLYTNIEIQAAKNPNTTKYAESAAPLGAFKNTNEKLQRPSSSPCKYDTRTKIKKKSDELQKILNEEKQQQPVKAEIIENQPPTVIVKQRCLSAVVTKVFETQEKDLKTNGMFPSHVNSKLPNPKTVIVSRPSSAVDSTTSAKQLQSTPIIKSQDINQTKMLIRNHKIDERPKSFQKERTTTVSEMYETNKLTANNDLKLMTHKEIAQIMKRVQDEHDATQKEMFKIEQNNYKKLWQLKCVGQYHGSLLARPKSMAPEIRE